MSTLRKEPNYQNWLKELKHKFRLAQQKAAVAINSNLILFYWELGSDIIEKQKSASWGEGFIKQLSEDLIEEFPDTKGFSRRNIEVVRQWYLFWNQCSAIAQQAVAQLSNPSEFVKKQQAVSQLESDSSNGQQSVTKLDSFVKLLISQLTSIPWGHNLVIVSKCKNHE